MTREEHLEWAKERALAYWNEGDYTNAMVSMLSDLSKHPELKNHPGLSIDISWLIAVEMNYDRDFSYKFITGFN